MIHLTLQQLSAYLDGELTDASTELIRRHLSECDACTDRFARIESQEEILARVLVDEPGEEFFEELSASIAEAIAPGARHRKSGSKSSAPARESDPAKSARGKSVGKKASLSPTAARSEAAATPAASVVATPASPTPPAAEPAPTAETPAAEPAVPAPATTPPAVERPAPSAAHPVARPAPAVSRAAPAPQYGRRSTDAVPVTRTGGGIGGYIATAVIILSVGSTGLVLYKRNILAPPPPAASDRAAIAPDGTTPEPGSDEPETVAESRPVAGAEQEAADPSPESVTSATEGTPSATVRPKAQTRKAGATPEPAERAGERTPQNVVPVRKFVTETTFSPLDEAAPPTTLNARDSLLAAQAAVAQAAAVRSRLLEDAQRSSARAAVSRSAAALDDAASAWERALPALQGSPEDLAVARREAAQARYQAWVAAPTEPRKAMAITAARAYLLYAPPGPERDQAWTWLARLKQ